MNERPPSIKDGLSKNPNVQRVNANILSFTAEFKEYAYNKD